MKGSFSAVMNHPDHMKRHFVPEILRPCLHSNAATSDSGVVPVKDVELLKAVCYIYGISYHSVVATNFQQSSTRVFISIFRRKLEKLHEPDT